MLKLDAEDHPVLLTMHHIVTDGWSFGIAAGELAALYEAFHAGEPSPLRELPLQYADYARWQRNWLQSEVLEDCSPTGGVGWKACRLSSCRATGLVRRFERNEETYTTSAFRPNYRMPCGR